MSESLSEDVSPLLVRHICTEMSLLANMARIPKKDDIAAALKEGDANLVFRQAIAALVNEFLGKIVPCDVASGFSGAIARTLRHATEFSPSLLLQDETSDGMLSKLESSIEARASLWLSLLGEVRANRLLEYCRYEQVPSKSLTCIASGTEHVVDRQRCSLSIATAELRSSGRIPNNVKDESLFLWLHSNYLSQKNPLFHSVVEQSSLTAKQLNLLHDVCERVRAEYRGRRQLLIRRFAMTLATHCESEEASIDKASLSVLAAQRLAALSSAPSVELCSVFTLSFLEVVMASEKMSIGATKFKDRNMVIPQVPDRGGRINTYNFDTKVEDAVRKADADLRHKTGFNQQQRDASWQGMRTDQRQGVGLGAHGAGAFERRGRGGNWSRGRY